MEAIASRFQIKLGKVSVKGNKQVARMKIIVVNSRLVNLGKKSGNLYQ